MNNISLIGRLVKDPEVKQTPNNVSVVSFTLAVNRDYAKNGERETDFIDCVAWRGTAEFIGRYFTKGKEMAVVGCLQTRMYEDQGGYRRKVTEVLAEKVNFVGSRTEQAPAESQQTDTSEETPEGLPFDVYGY